MKIFKKILGYLCVAECIFCIIMTTQVPSDTIIGLLIVTCVCGLYAYYLLKKTPTKISPLRVFLGVNFIGVSLGGTYTAFTSPQEKMVQNFTASIFCAFIAFMMLKGFKRRQPTEEYTAAKLNNVQFTKPIIVDNNSTNDLTSKQTQDTSCLCESNHFPTNQYLSDKDVKEKIQSDLVNMVKTENEYKLGLRNIFSDNQFSDEEHFFFKCVYEEFEKAGLKANLIILKRLGSGVFNVDYIGEGYLGKVGISHTQESFRVIKQGAKRASRIFKTLSEAELFIAGKANYTIEHTESTHTFLYNILLDKKYIMIISAR